MATASFSATVRTSSGKGTARKLRTAIDGLTRVVAIEVMTAARALDLRAPLEPGAGSQAVLELVRAEIDGLGPDRFLSPEIEAVASLVRRGAVRDAAAERLGGLN